MRVVVIPDDAVRDREIGASLCGGDDDACLVFWGPRAEVAALLRKAAEALDGGAVDPRIAAFDWIAAKCGGEGELHWHFESGDEEVSEPIVAGREGETLLDAVVRATKEARCKQTKLRS